MSSHICPVVKLGKPQPIPSADKLVFYEVEGNGPVVVAKEDFKEGDLATFIPPESCVDTALEAFAFLKSKARKPDGWCKIRPVRLRGQLSVGLLLPATGAEGSNGADKLKVKKFEEHVKVEAPKAKQLPWYRKLWLKMTGRHKEVPKGLYPGIPVYDINQLYKMPKNLFKPQEMMMVTEKLHGTNARYLIGKDSKLWCGSRTMWRLHDGSNVYSRAATSWGIEAKIRRLSEPLVLWGEIVGPNIQRGFSYGLGEGELKFYAFDMYHAVDRRFLDPSEVKDICHWLKIEYVPICGIDKWSEISQYLMTYATGQSYFGTGEHPREGIVVRPWRNVKETHALDGGKCLLAGKVINPAYLEFREKPGMDEQVIL